MTVKTLAREMGISTTAIYKAAKQRNIAPASLRDESGRLTEDGEALIREWFAGRADRDNQPPQVDDNHDNQAPQVGINHDNQRPQVNANHDNHAAPVDDNQPQQVDTQQQDEARNEARDEAREIAMLHARIADLEEERDYLRERLAEMQRSHAQAMDAMKAITTGMTPAPAALPAPKKPSRIRAWLDRWRS